MYSFRLDGQVALVTGASRNIGAAIAQALAAAGADVALVARDAEGLERTAASVAALGRRAVAIPMDIRDIHLFQVLVTTVEDRLGPIGILVNNAGGNIPRGFLEATPADYDQIMNLNLRSVFFLSQAVGGQMVRRGRGRIIHVSSQLGVVGLPGRSIYGTAKGGVNSLTRAMASELSPLGITVNAVAPTFIETSATASILADPTFREDVIRKLPIGRLGHPDDVTGAVVFLASDAAALITGTTLLVDGGYTAI